MEPNNTPPQPPEPPAPTPAPAPAPAPTPQPSQGNNELPLAVLAHLGGLFLSFLVPLVVFLVCKDKGDQPFVVEHAREALNFQLTVMIALIVLAFIPFLGWMLMLPVLLADFVVCLLATIKVINGESWRYPFSLRLIK